MNNKIDMEPNLDDTQKENKNNTACVSDLNFEVVENVEGDIQPSHSNADGPSVTTGVNGESTSAIVSDGPIKKQSSKERRKIKKTNLNKLKRKSRRLRERLRDLFNLRAVARNNIQTSKSRAACRRPVPKQHRQKWGKKTEIGKNKGRRTVVATAPDQEPNRLCTIEDCEVIIISENEDDEYQQPTCSTAAEPEMSPETIPTSAIIDLTTSDDEDAGYVLADCSPVADQHGNDDDELMIEIDVGRPLEHAEPWLVSHADVELPLPPDIVELREFFGIGMTVRSSRPGVPSTVQPQATRPPRPAPTGVIAQSPNATSLESQVVMLKNKIRGTVVEYAYLYEPNCIVDMLVARLRNGDLLHNMDTAWTTSGASDVKELLMWLTYSMSNNRMNIVPLMACLMITFRATVDTAQLSDAETCREFKIFINVIKRCFFNKDVQFWRTWMTTEHFLYGCCYVDHVLYSRAAQYRSMERRIKWNKVMAFKWYFRIPSYHVPLPSPSTENQASIHRITFRSLTPPLTEQPRKIKMVDQAVQVNIGSEPNLAFILGLAPSSSRDNST